LSNDPPEVVVMVDADCLVQKGSIDRLVRQTLRTQQPVQGTYLMERPVPPKPKDAVSALAFMVKNLVRPQGLAQLGLPCLLTGTGMAFPWSVLSQISLASSNLVEDMQMAIDLAIAGHSASFCASACVMGMLPQQDQAAKTQRTRWEHGHLQTLLTQVPKLVKAAVQQKRFDLLSMALDLSVPPVSLLVMLWLAATASAVLAMLLGGSWVPVTLLITEGFMLLVAVLAAWAKFGRADLPARTLLAVPFYVLWKLPLYITFITQPQRKWVRTARDASTSEHPQ
jgi:cellulose synthase/poly-beta-1,6-N-acetylglucosamine synthase-like glycosyltransferase